jgi:uncharacterized protein (DUF362 family)
MNNAEKQDHRVLVVECPDYDAKKIRAIIDQGMDTLGFKPRGQVAIKPNVVFAYKPEVFSPAAYTNFDVIEGAIRSVSDQTEVSRIAVTETSAVGNPTRFSFRWAGYTERIRKLRPEMKKPLRLVAIDEERRQPVFVGGKVHHRVRLSRTFARADTRIYMPKLKCHCVSKMTGAVKLNVGIVSFDERSIRHDFLLNEKIADLLTVGWPDFVIMDAITVGVGNEALPIPRSLGLILMGRNPLAVDLVASRLLGMQGESEVPYLAVVIGRGYRPARLEEVTLLGDASGVADLDRYAERIKPYDDEFYQWQDINKELKRLNSPLRLFQGPYSDAGEDCCETGCIMGLKMFLAFLESYAGAEAFARARPAIFIIGKVKEPVDAKGGPVFIIGSCSRAEVKNPGKVTRIDKCFVTASDMFLLIGHQTGIKSPFFDPRFLMSYVPNLLAGTVKKVFNLRYAQDFGDFIKQQLFRKI